MPGKKKRVDICSFVMYQKVLTSAEPTINGKQRWVREMIRTRDGNEGRSEEMRT